MTKNNDTFKIRPAGRHILTIGRDLIQDVHSAIIELVKNAYDADATRVNISLSPNPNEKGYVITISDNGHGMSRNVVINKWMVPSTDDKLKRKESPNGRIMQGRKGIGRYAASILGNDLLLETVTPSGEKTSLYIEWDSFSEAEFLDNVEILIESSKSVDKCGTALTINSDDSSGSEFNEKTFKKLTEELQKLIPPFEEISNEKFEIRIEIQGFGEETDRNEIVQSFPIFKLFDYKIVGSVTNDGTGILKYSQQNAKNSVTEEIEIKVAERTNCGNLYFDIRVYDREPEAIGALVGRGLKDQFSKQYVGKQEAKNILDLHNGIGVYRNGFRIRPLGDSDYDWLKLNKRRVDNPSMRIGTNQVIGYVLIEREESSHLIEKSARDGLINNSAFKMLVGATNKVIGELEARRFNYRSKAGLSRKTLEVEKDIERLFSFDELKSGIRKSLSNSGIETKAIQEVLSLINQSEKQKSEAVTNIRKTVAFYQGQATLGKIMSIVLHEGRQPLSYFRTQTRSFNDWLDKYNESGDISILIKLKEKTRGLSENAIIFSKLFSRLDPLAVGKRSPQKLLNIYSSLKKIASIFESKLSESNIELIIQGDKNISDNFWEQDLYSIFTNLIDNSIYWICEKRCSVRKIEIIIKPQAKQTFFIDYQDSGPGIEASLIESQVIFEPHFSTKPNGMGLGLAIAGESAIRNGYELAALESDFGAYFRIQQQEVFTDEYL